MLWADISKSLTVKYECPPRCILKFKQFLKALRLERKLWHLDVSVNIVFLNRSLGVIYNTILLWRQTAIIFGKEVYEMPTIIVSALPERITECCKKYRSILDLLLIWIFF